MARPARDHQEIAAERIERLLCLAAAEAAAGPDRAARHVAMARRIGMRYNVRIPRARQRRFCSRCSAWLLPGNHAIRTSSREQAVLLVCHACHAVMRFPYRKEKRLRAQDKRQHTAVFSTRAAAH